MYCSFYRHYCVLSANVFLGIFENEIELWYLVQTLSNFGIKVTLTSNNNVSLHLLLVLKATDKSSEAGRHKSSILWKLGSER